MRAVCIKILKFAWRNSEVWMLGAVNALSYELESFLCTINWTSCKVFGKIGTNLKIVQRFGQA